jgi:hypothetical protein
VSPAHRAGAGLSGGSAAVAAASRPSNPSRAYGLSSSRIGAPQFCEAKLRPAPLREERQSPHGPRRAAFNENRAPRGLVCPQAEPLKRRCKKKSSFLIIPPHGQRQFSFTKLPLVINRARREFSVAGGPARVKRRAYNLGFARVMRNRPAISALVSSPAVLAKFSSR